MNTQPTHSSQQRHTPYDPFNILLVAFFVQLSDHTLLINSSWFLDAVIFLGTQFTF